MSKGDTMRSESITKLVDDLVRLFDGRSQVTDRDFPKHYATISVKLGQLAELAGLSKDETYSHIADYYNKKISRGKLMLNLRAVQLIMDFKE